MEAETLHIFDAYSRGELSDAARLEFEQKVASDPELKKEFDEYIHIVNGIREYERERILRQMQDVKSRQLNPGWKALKSVSVAAAVVLAIVIPGYVIFRVTTQDSRLIKEYRLEDPGVPVTMGASSNSIFSQAMVEYKDHNFKESLEKIQLLLVEKPGNDTLNYYAGICEMETNGTDAAIRHFEKIIDPASAYYLLAKYNTGLCYFKSGNNTKALEALEIVASQGRGEIKDQAAELISKIKT